MFKYNMDYKVRDSMLHFRNPEKAKDDYDVLWFDGLEPETLEKLIDLRFADPKERQNYSPSTAEFLEFLNENDEFTAIGYVVSPNRDDYRLTIEGVEAYGCDERQIYNFVNMFRKADEFEMTPVYQRAWFD